MISLAETLCHLNAQIAAAGEKAGRGPGAARLLAVSKNVDAARIEEALLAGQLLFGENYVQEAASKWAALRPRYPEARLHFIGHLQSNKAVDAVTTFDRIDSLDRPTLAAALAAAMKKTGRDVPLLIEVNIGREPQKHGCAPDEVGALLAHSRALGLRVEGVMAIPPADKNPEPFFRELAALALHHGLPEISMGMSNDFARAIACGSTLVRLGTALFGARQP